MGSFAETWKQEKNQRHQMLSLLINDWTKKPTQCIEDFSKKDYGVIDWETIYNGSPLWVYLFFDQYSPFALTSSLSTTNEKVFKAWCETRSIKNVTLPLSWNVDALTLASQPKAHTNVFSLQDAFTVASKSFCSREDYDCLHLLIELSDILALKYKTTHYQGAVAVALSPYLHKTPMPKEIEKWWFEQHSTLFCLRSSSRSYVSTISEEALSPSFLMSDPSLEKQEFLPYRIQAVYKLYEKRYATQKTLPLILPSVFKNLDFVLEKYFSSEENAMEYKSFIEKLLVMDATSSWPFQTINSKLPASSRKM